MKKDFVYLASASPWRAELLRQIGVDFQVRPSDLPEQVRPGEAPADYVLRLARDKAAAVWNGLGAAVPAPVVAADTTVVLDGQVLGKPDSAAAAAAMLDALSGRVHRVLTAVAVHFETRSEGVLSSSEVTFRALSDAEKRAYCATDEPYDKAGGYGIQGLAAVFISHLGGSYSAVMGLPLLETAALLRRFGLPRWLGEAETACEG
jgi:septum formation protein